ncbi:hypothetical protein BsWGS_06526 [Bradybaena similaris]
MCTCVISRNRGHRRNRRKDQHVFSARRLLLMAFCGIMLFVPGLALTIVGLENSEAEQQSMNEVQKIIYRVVGPSMSTVGAIVMFASCLYFYCYGTNPQPPQQIGSQHQSFSEPDPEDKGSIRSKQRDHGHHHHFNQQNNGRAVDVNTPDSDCRRNFKLQDNTSPIIAPHRTSVTTEEEVPLAKIEDVSDNRKGQ